MPSQGTSTFDLFALRFDCEADEPVLFPAPELLGETLTALSERLADRSRQPAERRLVGYALVVVGAAALGAGALMAMSRRAGPATV